MKLAVISDVHGNQPALEAVFEDIQDDDTDAVVCCGDIVGILGWPATTAKTIQLMTGNTVFGNHDARVREDFVYAPSFPAAQDEHKVVTELLTPATVEWLNSLPDRIETDEYIMAHSWPSTFQDAETSLHGFQTGDRGVTPRHATKAGKAANGKVVLLGHTHEQFTLNLEKFQGLSGTIVNPGSVGVPWYGDAEYAIVDTATHEVDLRSVEYDTDAVKERLDALHDEYSLYTWPEARRGAP